MRRFLPINLFLSSLAALFVFACSPVTCYKFVKSAKITGQDAHPIIPAENALLYKAQIDLYNRHFSGLIILKQLDKEISHLTFVTEIGMKMFDFEIRDTSFKLVYVFEPLDKPKITTLLQNDMQLILLQHLLNKEASVYENKNEKIFKVHEVFCYYYKLNIASKTIEKIKKRSSLFTKVKVNYLYDNNANATSIKLKHKGLIRLKIELKNIAKNP